MDVGYDPQAWLDDSGGVRAEVQAVEVLADEDQVLFEAETGQTVPDDHPESLEVAPVMCNFEPAFVEYEEQGTAAVELLG